MGNNIMDKVKEFFNKHKKGIKCVYIVFIICLIFYAIYSIHKQTSLNAIIKACTLLSVSKTISIIILGILSVIPMVIYDFVYTRKVNNKIHLPVLLKDSYIINSITNAGGGGGMLGANLRVFLFGKASKSIGETAKIVAQIALFTMIGLVTNDGLACLLNIRSLLSLPFTIKLTCGLFLLYAFAPFIIPTKRLNLKDHIWLTIGSSLEWLFALGFFLIVGLIMGIHFTVIPAYLVVCFAGIVGAASLIPGGLGSFDVALIFGMHQIGVSTGTAVTWALLYRVGYYIIPFVIGLIMLLITVIHRKIIKK